MLGMILGAWQMTNATTMKMAARVNRASRFLVTITMTTGFGKQECGLRTLNITREVEGILHFSYSEIVVQLIHRPTRTKIQCKYSNPKIATKFKDSSIYLLHSELWLRHLPGPSSLWPQEQVHATY